MITGYRRRTTQTDRDIRPSPSPSYDDGSDDDDDCTLCTTLCGRHIFYDDREKVPNVPCLCLSPPRDLWKSYSLIAAYNKHWLPFVAATIILILAAITAIIAISFVSYRTFTGTDTVTMHVINVSMIRYVRYRWAYVGGNDNSDAGCNLLGARWKNMEVAINATSMYTSCFYREVCVKKKPGKGGGCAVYSKEYVTYELYPFILTSWRYEARAAIATNTSLGSQSTIRSQSTLGSYTLTRECYEHESCPPTSIDGLVIYPPRGISWRVEDNDQYTSAVDDGTYLPLIFFMISAAILVVAIIIVTSSFIYGCHVTIGKKYAERGDDPSGRHDGRRDYHDDMRHVFFEGGGRS